MPTSKVDIAFRIGVTGAISASATEGDKLWDRVLDVVHKLRGFLIEASADAALDGIRTTNAAKLRVLSPLAQGADRVVAETALWLEENQPNALCSTQLEAILPFVQAEYEETFGSTSGAQRDSAITAFRDLLEKSAHVTELDGAREPEEVRHNSYGAVGRAVVRNCDLLIAVWDPGMKSKGPGGTRDTVAYAHSTGVPVLVVHPSGEEVVWWSTRVGMPRDLSTDAFKEARSYMRTVLLPPSPIEGRHESAWVRRLRSVLGMEVDPLRAYFLESDRQNPNIWRARDWFLGPLLRYGRRAKGFSTSNDLCNNLLLRFWARYRAIREPSSRAAQLATKYQQRFRTSYFAILVAAAIALLIAVYAVAFYAPVWLILVELLLLVAIAAIWVANDVCDWHQRYVSYRVLAELQRTLPALQATARTAPGTRLTQASKGNQRWVAWVYSAIVRSTIPADQQGEALSKTTSYHRVHKTDITLELVQSLITNQKRYHSARIAECEFTSGILALAAKGFFWATLMVVTCKLLLYVEALRFIAIAYPSVPSVLSLLAVIFPILAAALFTLRTYEELEILVDQSSLMLEELEEIELRIAQIDISKPVSLEKLGGEVVGLARLLILDVREWAQVFKLKAVEGA